MKKIFSFFPVSVVLLFCAAGPVFGESWYREWYQDRALNPDTYTADWRTQALMSTGAFPQGEAGYRNLFNISRENYGQELSVPMNPPQWMEDVVNTASFSFLETYGDESGRRWGMLILTVTEGELKNRVFNILMYHIGDGVFSLHIWPRD
jgi:hypothetical protein